MDELSQLVADARDWLGLEAGFDIIQFHLPTSFDVTGLSPLIAALEGLVKAGHTGSYGTCFLFVVSVVNSMNRH